MIHAVRRLSLNEKLQPVTHLAKLKLGALARHLILIFRLRRERNDRIQNRRRLPERSRVQPYFVFPGMPIQR